MIPQTIQVCRFQNTGSVHKMSGNCSENVIIDQIQKHVFAGKPFPKTVNFRTIQIRVLSYKVPIYGEKENTGTTSRMVKFWTRILVRKYPLK